MSTYTVNAYIADSKAAPFRLGTIERRALGPNDIKFKISYCGVCHSDLSLWKDEMGITPFPLVPGHEIVGIVEEVGANVTKFKPGSRIGVGCYVDSCRECANCQATPSEENLCKSPSFTYGFPDPRRNEIHYGGYSDNFVVDERFALHIPENLDLAAAAPLLCAGITVYTPLVDYGFKGAKIGVVGVGGLGHMAIKLAKALGYHIVAFTTKAEKKDSLLSLGAHDVAVTTDPDSVTKFAGHLDLIIDTVSGPHDLALYASTLKARGRYHLVGLNGSTLNVPFFPLLMKQLSFSASPVGSLHHTQQMLNLCGEHNITADIELVHIKDIQKVYERLEKGDVRYRFVFDIENDFKSS